MLFRLIGWLSIIALAIGLVILALDAVGIHSAAITKVNGIVLVLGGIFVSGTFATIQVFFFSDRPRREQWREYYRQSILPFRALENLIAHRRRDKTSRSGLHDTSRP